MKYDAENNKGFFEFNGKSFEMKNIDFKVMHALDQYIRDVIADVKFLEVEKIKEKIQMYIDIL